MDKMTLNSIPLQHYSSIVFIFNQSVEDRLWQLWALKNRINTTDNYRHPFLKKSKTSFLRLNFIRVVDLQFCISFCCTSKGMSYTYMYIHSFLDFIPIYIITEYWIEFPVLNSRFLFFTYFIHSSVYMRSGLTFIPKSSFALKSQENPSFISTLALCYRNLINRGWNQRRLRDVFWIFKKGVRKTKTSPILNHLYVESYKRHKWT